MDDPILFNPDNRLLGGATGDLSLYGGQSDPKFSVHQARDDAPSSQGPAAQGMPGAIPTAAPNADLGESISPGGSGETVHQGGGAPAPSAFLITSPETAFDPVTLVSAASPAGAPSVLSDWNPASPGAGSTNPAQAGAADAADAMHGAVTGTAAAMLDDLAGTASGIAAGALSPIADTAGTVLHTTIGAVDDTLDGLAGSDPLGGVATLVSLVSVSDMFDLNPVDAPLVEAVVDPGLGVLDTLAGEELLPDTLLGAHHDDGLLGGHIDHPLGL